MIENFRILAKAAKSGNQIASGERFLDNLHIVERQIREVQKGTARNCRPFLFALTSATRWSGYRSA